MADGSVVIDTEINNDGMKKGIKNIESGFDKLKSTITKTIAALGLGKLAKDFISTGIQYNEEVEKYQTALTTLTGSAQEANKIVKQIKQDAAATPFDVAGLTQANQLLISTGLDAEESRETILALGNAISATGGGNEELSRMAINLQQIKNTGKAAAIDIKQFAFAGIDIYGLLADYLKISREEASEMEVTWEDLNGALLSASKEGGKYFGAMTEQSKTLNGQWSTLKDNFKEFAGTVLTPLTNILKDTVLPVMNEFIGNLKEGVETTNWKETLEVIKKIGAIIIPLTTSFITFKTAIAISGTISKLKASITATKTAFMAFNAVLAANPIAIIVTLIVGLVTAIIYLWNTNDNFKNALISTWKSIKEAIYNVITSVLSFFTESIPNAYNNLIEKIKGFGDTIWQYAINLWNKIVTFFTESIPNFIVLIINWFANLPYKIGFFIGSLIGYIINFGKNIKNWISNELPQIIENIIQWFASLPEKIWNWLINAVEKIKDWGQSIYNITQEKISQTINNIVDWFSKLPEKIWNWLLNTIEKIQKWGKDIAEKGKQGAQDLFNKILNTIKELPTKVQEVGKNIVEGLWNGIKNAGNWIKEQVGNFARGILDGMKSALGIHSPSRVFRDEVGKNIALGVGEGFTKNIGQIYRQMKATVDFETQRLSSNITANQQINVERKSSLQAALNSIDNNREIVVNSTLEVDGKKMATVVNKANTMQKLRYGIA